MTTRVSFIQIDARAILPLCVTSSLVKGKLRYRGGKTSLTKGIKTIISIFFSIQYESSLDNQWSETLCAPQGDDRRTAWHPPGESQNDMQSTQLYPAILASLFWPMPFLARLLPKLETLKQAHSVQSPMTYNN